MKKETATCWRFFYERWSTGLCSEHSDKIGAEGNQISVKQQVQQSILATNVGKPVST